MSKRRSSPAKPPPQDAYQSESDTEHYYYDRQGVPVDPDGRVLHLGVAPGDVANRLVLVGSKTRFDILSQLFDKKPPARSRTSARGFSVTTGCFDGIRASVVFVGMGSANMDFVVRETRAVVDGPMLMVRFGSCGAIHPDMSVGTLGVCTDGSVMVTQNPDHFTADPSEDTPAYRVSRPVAADPILSQRVLEELVASLGPDRIVGCANASADSFYSSQGRVTPDFDDRNERVLAILEEVEPVIGTLEMETFQLLHLARLCKSSVIRASAAAMVLANRTNDDTLPRAEIEHLEAVAGEAIMRAITTVKL